MIFRKMPIRKKKYIKIILQNENDIKNKKKKFTEEVEKEVINVEKQIKNLKINSLTKIDNMATEVTKVIVKKIINTEVNTSNVLAIVQSISKKMVEKYK